MAIGAIERPPFKVGSITKARFLRAAVCTTAAWWDTYDPIRAPLSEPVRFRIEEGRRIQALARARYPGAVLVEPLNMVAAASLTRDLVEETGVHIIFEAAFASGPFVARADVIVRQPNATAVTDTWRLIEIKSGTNINGYLCDLAYSVMLARRAGLDVRTASIVALNREYTPEMASEGSLAVPGGTVTAPPADLFVETDCTEEVDAIIEEDLEPEWDTVAQALGAERRPRPSWRPECKKCRYFDTRCVGRGIQHPVTDLPRLYGKPWDTIMSTGARGIRGIPPAALQGDGVTARRWRRIYDAVRTGKPWVSDHLSDILAAIQWPARFLDFETTQHPIPVYPGTHPYEQIVTQYSLHTVASRDVLRACDGLSAAAGASVHGVTHAEFLAADASVDCRRELLEQLLSDLGDTGSIVVYSPFESQMLRALADRFPQYADAIESVTSRLYDLCDVVRDHYYDARFHGSFSIKTVLPVLAPDLSYEALGAGAVADGITASVLFARAARGELSSEAWAKLREQLLEYCKLDTWGMVRVLKALAS